MTTNARKALVAAAVAAGAIAAAVWAYDYHRTGCVYGGGCYIHPAWANPLAGFLLVIGGLGFVFAVTTIVRRDGGVIPSASSGATQQQGVDLELQAPPTQTTSQLQLTPALTEGARALKAIGYVIGSVWLYAAATGATQKAPPAGLVTGFLILLIIGTVGWVISRGLRHDRRWSQVVFGRFAIITTGVLLTLSWAGHLAGPHH
jgi:hypothetical protein